jgi:excisionase family DNA binding protein
MDRGSLAGAHLLVTVSDAARHLRRHEQTIRAMIRRGELATVRFGRVVRVFASAVETAHRRLSAAAPSPAVAAAPRRGRRPVRRDLVPSAGL